MNLKLYYIDNVKRSHESTSVEESKKLHASRGDKNERDADRSALVKLVTREKRKSARMKRQQAMVRLVTMGSYCMY